MKMRMTTKKRVGINQQRTCNVSSHNLYYVLTVFHNTARKKRKKKLNRKKMKFPHFSSLLVQLFGRVSMGNRGEKEIQTDGQTDSQGQGRGKLRKRNRKGENSEGKVRGFFVK